MNEICNCNCCETTMVKKRLTFNNFKKVTHNADFMLQRLSLDLCIVRGNGIMHLLDGSMMLSINVAFECTESNIHTYQIDNFIKDFVPIWLEPFEHRLIGERMNLYHKSISLKNFIDLDPRFTELDENDKELMEKQYAAMKVYYDFLNQRVVKMLKQKIEDYDALPSTGEEVEANVAEPANVL